MPRPWSWQRVAWGVVLVALTAGCPPRSRPGGQEVAAAPAKDDPPAEGDLELGDLEVDHDAATAEAPEPPAVRPWGKDVSPATDQAGAIQAVAAGNHEGALAFLDAWTRGHPDDLAAIFAQAHASASLGDLARAEALLAAVQRKAPLERSAILRARARLAGRRGDLKGAEALLREALAAAQGDLAAQGELLSFLVERGRGKEPEAKKLMEGLYDAYDAGKAKTAEELQAIAQAALARGTSGAFHDANMVLGDAEKAAPRGIEPEFLVRERVLLIRGAIFREKYASRDAAETYGLLLERDPWHPDALSGLALAGLDEFKLAEADRLARRALQTDKDHPAAHAVLARIAAIEGRRAEARQEAKLAQAVDPGQSDALAVLAAAAIVEGDRKAAQVARDQALASTGTGARYSVTLADLLASMHLYPEADEVLREAAERAPDDPYVASAYGLSRLRLGDESVGRAALTRAWKKDRFNERTRNVLDLYDNHIDKDYADVDEAKLRLRLPKEDQDYVVDGLVGAYKRARAALDRRYGVDPGVLRLEVFADGKDFSIRTVGVPSLGAVGVCFGPLITLVGPYEGSHNVDQVIWHELAHVYAIRLSQGRVPRWFTEGLSEWESELADPAWARESADLLVAARRRGKLRRLGELELAFLRAESALGMEVAYASAAYALRFLGETYGHDKIKAILRGYADGSSSEALFVKILGKDMGALEVEFDAWLQKRLDAAIHGWSPSEGKPSDPRDKLYQAAIAEVRGGDYDGASRTLQKLIQSGGDGYRSRLALAEVLLQGPSWQAAEAHLQKAHEFNREAIEPLVRAAEVARRRGDLAAEKKVLGEALAIDAMSYDPAARLLMLAMVSGDDAALTLARARAVAIAPLHPLTLAARAHAAARAGDKPKASALLKRSLQSTPEGGPVDTLVVMALAADAAGDKDTAKILAARAKGDPKLPKAAGEALARIGGAAAK
ncbi:MAG: hypothetical protein R3B09_17730 [Nannocystaceae bacterium]